MSFRWPALVALALAAAPLGREAPAQPYSDPGPAIGVSGSVGWVQDAHGNGFGGSVFGRTRVTGGLGLEAGVGYLETAYELDGEEVLVVRGLPLTVSGLVYFLANRPWQPYVVLGVGLLYAWSTPAPALALPKETQAVLTLGFGAGVEARLARRVTAHLDVRLLFDELDSVAAIVGANNNSLSVRAGAAYHF